MKTFDVTLKGFDAGTDKTDHLVKWVRSENRQVLDQWLQNTGIVEVVRDITDMADHAVDFEQGVDVKLCFITTSTVPLELGVNLKLPIYTPHFQSCVMLSYGDYYQLTMEEFDPKVWIDESNAVTQTETK